jgi:hypothetical protein
VRATVVDPPQLAPAHDVSNGWNMIGFESIAANVTATDYLDGTEYVRIYRLKDGASSFRDSL